MEPLKKDAINIINNLPDDADMEEIMYRLYVLENPAWTGRRQKSQDHASK